MNILIYANCQTSQLVYGLTFALAGKANIYGIDIHHSEQKQQIESFFEKKIAIDYVITNINCSELKNYFDEKNIIHIPSIHFGGFHPDVIYFSSSTTPDTPNFFMNNPTISAIGLWMAVNKLGKEKIPQLYNEDVFTKLGYIDYFDISTHAIRSSYQKYDIGLEYIDRHISSRDVFMYGPMHPKFEVTLSLCFGILEKLNIKPVNDFQQVKSVMIDPLQFEYAWGCFPPVAQNLGVESSWFIRHNTHIFTSLSHYLDCLLPFIHDFQTKNGTVQMMNRDKERFESFHNMDKTLRSYI